MTGTYNLSGTGNLTSNSVSLGFPYGTGIFTQNGGTHTVITELSLGIGLTSVTNGSYSLQSGVLTAGGYGVRIISGIFTQSGGNLSVNGYLRLNGISNRPGTGLFTQSGGTNSVNYLMLGENFYSNNIYEYGIYNLSGTGSLITATDEYIGCSGTGTFNQSGGRHTITGSMTLAVNANTGNGTYNHTGGTLTVNNGITNNVGGIFSAGAGTTATVGGPGFINHGLLKGAGTIAGNVTSDGTVGPGNSPGALNITGDYTQLANGIFDVEIGGTLAGSEYDTLNVSGTASLDGTLNVSLFDLGSGLFAPQAGDSFDILTAETLSGSFSSLSYAALLDPNLSWQSITSPTPSAPPTSCV